MKTIKNILTVVLLLVAITVLTPYALEAVKNGSSGGDDNLEATRIILEDKKNSLIETIESQNAAMATSESIPPTPILAFTPVPAIATSLPVPTIMPSEPLIGGKTEAQWTQALASVNDNLLKAIDFHQQCMVQVASEWPNVVTDCTATQRNLDNARNLLGALKEDYRSARSGQ